MKEEKKMNYPDFGLKNKIAIVTGGNKGIGKGTALCLANAGSDVVIAGRTQSELEQVASEVEKMGRKSLPIVMDVTRKQSVDSMVHQALMKFGRIDVLVNSAGVSEVLPPEEYPEEVWDKIIDTNLKGVFLCCQSVGKAMIKQKSGVIINISSQAGSVALPNHAAYCASKGGVNLLTKVLALDWAQYNIRVNAVGPTVINTPMADQIFGDPEVRAETMKKIPIGHFGDVEDVAGAVIFLASDASKMITGHILLVDGGWTIQ